MLSYWLILAASLGQTSQPAAERPAAMPISVAAKPEQPFHVPTTTRPASGGLRMSVASPSAPATQPAVTRIDVGGPPSVPPSDDLMNQLALAAGLGPITTQPAGELAPVQQSSGLTGNPIDIQVTADGGIAIMADPQDVAIIQNLIKQMDQGVPTKYELFKLNNAQAGELGTKLQDFWTKLKTPQKGQIRPQDRITIIAEPRANVLMVGATAEAMDDIRRIVKELDVPALDVERSRFVAIQLQYIKAGEAAEKIKTLLKSRQERLGITKNIVDIQADDRTRSLLVSASEDDLAIIRELIKVIDVEPSAKTGGVVKMAVYQLNRAVAKDLADALSKMLTADSDAAKAAQEQIRRLQVQYRKNGEARELPDVDLELPIKIFPEPGTNSIMVATVEKNIEPIGELVKLLDSVPLADEMLIRIFPLKFADAETLQKNLKDIFDQGKNLPKQPDRTIPGPVPPGIGGSLVYNIGLSSDKRTNTLVVSGRAEQLLLVQRVIDAVDVKEDANVFIPRLITLKNADAKRIAEVANKIAEQRQKIAEKLSPLAAERERTLVIEDVRTNSLIIVAKDENYNDLKSMAEKLDGMPDDFLGEIRIINLQNLTAADLADKIEQLWKRRLEFRREGNLKADQPVLVTDTRSNSLIIASNQDDFNAISKLIAQLEQQKLNPMAEIRQIILKHNEAAKVREIIQKLFDERLKQSLTKGQEARPGDQIAMADDALTNTLLIASSKSNYEEVVGLVAQLDVPPTVNGLVRIFYVKNALAKDTAEKIQQLFDKGLYSGGGDRKLPDSEKKITIIPDPRSGALVVSASPQNFSIIETLLEELDRVDMPALPVEARFFRIENADVVTVADMLDQLFQGMKANLPDEKTQLEVKLIPDIRSNTLIVAGSKFAIKRAEELVPKLDASGGEPTSAVKVYDLKQAAAGALQKVMKELFDKRAEGDAKGKRTPVNILADEGSNSLIVTAAQDDHSVVAHMLSLLDRKSALAEQIEIFPLKEAKAAQISDKLSKIVEQQMGERKTAFSVTPEERTNSLIVFAPPNLLSNIRSVVEKLDNSRVKTEMAMKVAKLKNQNAEDMAKLLDDFFKAAGAGQDKDAKQLIIRFTQMDPETGVELLHSLVHQDITIKPDKTTNSLLIMAPESNIEMMNMLIQMLDSVEIRTAKIRSYQLRNADATEMKDLLEELFNTKGGKGGSETTERRRLVFGAEGAADGGAAGAGSNESTLIDLAFSVDRRTNTLIAAGSDSYLMMVERLILQLDYEEIDERVVRVVPVHNKPAEELAKTLDSYFKAESGVLKEGEAKEAAVRQIQREVTIQDAGKESNVLLLTYSPRMESTVLGLINELDQPPPQVMIQVLIAEVTLTDNFEFGMEFALQDLLFSTTAVEGPNGLLQSNEFDFIGGTDVGASGSAGLGGFTFTITGEDFNFLVRALQTEGRLEVMARPSILVLDKQDANITIGERVPTVQDVVISSGGVVTPSVTYEEVGVILDVTPIINPDGFVNLKIKPEISAIGTSSVTVASGVSLPTFTQRKAETVVTVKDGQTIIIGGLITNRENESENKVPLVGDIPILGMVARANIKTTTKTELLILLTPHVIRSAEDAQRIGVNMRDQTGMMENMRRSPLMQGLQAKPEDDQLGPVDQQLRPIGGSSAPAAPPARESEEMGPKLEEQGPEARMIQMGPERELIAARAD